MSVKIASSHLNPRRAENSAAAQSDALVFCCVRGFHPPRAEQSDADDGSMISVSFCHLNSHGWGWHRRRDCIHHRWRDPHHSPVTDWLVPSGTMLEAMAPQDLPTDHVRSSKLTRLHHYMFAQSVACWRPSCFSQREWVLLQLAVHTPQRSSMIYHMLLSLAPRPCYLLRRLHGSIRFKQEWSLPRGTGMDLMVSEERHGGGFRR